jgi:hypothetical protein
MAEKAKKTEIELPKANQVVRVKAHADGYRRAGVPHTVAPVDHAHDAFTAAQLEELHGDPRISIQYVDKPKLEPKDGKGKGE